MSDPDEVYTQPLDKSKPECETDQADQYFNSATGGAANRTIFLCIVEIYDTPAFAVAGFPRCHQPPRSDAIARV